MYTITITITEEKNGVLSTRMTANGTCSRRESETASFIARLLAFGLDERSTARGNSDAPAKLVMTETESKKIQP